MSDLIARWLFALLGATAARAPRMTYAVVDAVAAASRPARRGARADEIAAVFPHLGPAEVETATQRVWNTRLRNKTLAATIDRFGMDPVRPLLRIDPAVLALEPPAVLGAFHIGPLFAVGAALEELRGEVLVLRRQARRTRPRANVTAYETGDDEQQRALAFQQAVSALRAGHFVVLPLDPARAARVEAPAFGRRLALGRGAFALARLSRAPVVPIVARWQGASVLITCGDPVAPDDDAESMATTVAMWLERYLLEHPEQIGHRTLELLR